MDNNENTPSPVAPLKLELRNVSYNKRLSEETACFAAVVYIDGVAAFNVSNRGQGGCDDHYPVKGQNYEQMRAQVAKAEAYAKTLPSRKYAGMTLEMDLELLCVGLLNDYLARKQLKSLLNKNLLFLEDGNDVDLFKSAKKEGSSFYRAYLLGRAPGYKFLNAMPFEEALQTFLKLTTAS